MFKWFAGGVGIVLGVAHIGVLGHLIDSNSLPQFIPPEVGPRTSYTVEATRDGYIVRYRGDDPTVMTEEVHVESGGGFLGFGGRRTTSRTTEYTESGQGGRDNAGKPLTAQQLACIEAAGGGRAQGAIVGSSVGAGLIAPALSGIPYVGWLAAGWATLFASDTIGDIGANVATTIKGCE